MQSFDLISCCSFKTVAHFNDTVGSVATSFLWNDDSKYFLITAWHVVSGRHFRSKRVLSKNGLVPNKLIVHVCVFRTKKLLTQWWPITIPLYHENAQSRFLVHPTKEESVDVVAIPLGTQFVSDVTKAAAKNLKVAEGDLTMEFANVYNKKMLLMVADDVFIVGFPEAISAGHLFPVWKRASVASEPAVDVDGLPLFLVDTLGKQGLSGSPVYQRATTGHYFEEPGRGVISDGPVSNLIGLYSGRLGSEEAEAQLGIVFKRILIEEIVRSGKFGRSSFEF